jgi:hypothetical protein
VESIIVPLTSCLTGLDKSVLQIKTNIVSCHTADSKRVKQEINGTVILPLLVFPALSKYTGLRLFPTTIKYLRLWHLPNALGTPLG